LTRVWCYFEHLHPLSHLRAFVCCLDLTVLDFLTTSGRVDDKNDWLSFAGYHHLGNTIGNHSHTRRQNVTGGEHRLPQISWLSYANGMLWWKKHYSSCSGETGSALSYARSSHLSFSSSSSHMRRTSSSHQVNLALDLRIQCDLWRMQCRTVVEDEATLSLSTMASVADKFLRSSRPYPINSLELVLTSRLLRAKASCSRCVEAR
jgi:hypothetical protein